ncbi:hypothetical protein SEA_DELRIO_37 [Gordonia phage DelRio]|nr:hypothetical protein SEA_DELRIO_37 [Gordonia phage DelRio]
MSKHLIPLTTTATAREVAAQLAELGVSPADFDCAKIARFVRMFARDAEHAARGDGFAEDADPDPAMVVEMFDTFATRDDAPYLADLLAA